MKKYYRILYIVIATLIIISLSLLFLRDNHNNQDFIIQQAFLEANASFNKDLVLRRWASMHGGVYVPVDSNTPPNKYLTDVKERDIVTPSGRQLTLMNPAYMNRQVHELSDKQYGTKDHITSLKPIRPENAPDEWEKKALKKFESGEKSFSEISLINGKKFYRFMKPLIAEKPCLKCHEFQGYKVGEIRGGISVSLPWEPFELVSKKDFKNNIVLYSSLLIVLMLTLFVTFHIHSRIKRSQQKSEDFLKLIRYSVDNSNDSIFWYDENAKIIFVNNFGCKQLGYSLEELLNLTILDIDPTFKLENWKIQFSNTKNTGKSKFETYHKTKDGLLIPVEIVATHINYINQSFNCAIVRDITERKQAEEKIRETEAKFKIMFDNSRDAISVSRRSVRLYVNQSFMDMFQYSNLEMIIGQPVWSNISPPEQEKMKLRIKQRAAGEDIPTFYQTVGVKKDGSQFDLEISVSTFNQDGEPLTLAMMRDVTERNKLQEELRMSEEKFSKAFRSIPESISIASLDDGKYIDVNDTFLKTSGFSRDEVIGKTSDDLKVWISSAERDDYVGKLISQKSIHKDEIRFRMKNGDIRNFIVSSEIIIINNQYCSLNFIFDITDRKIAEIALKKSEERYESFITHTHEALYCTEFDLPIDISLPIETIIDEIYKNAYMGICNEAMSKIYGFDSINDFIGKRLIEFHGGNNNEINRNVFRNFIRSGFRTIDSVSQEIFSDGSIHYFQSNDLGIIEDDKLVRIWGTAIEITEKLKSDKLLKESEERNRAIVESTTDWIWEIDKNGSYIYSSQKIESILGYTSEEIIGKTPFDLMDPNEVEQVKERFVKITENKEKIKDLENWNLHKNGNRVCLITNGFPVLSESGELLGYRGADKDITSRKIAEEELKNSERKLRSYLDFAPHGIFVTDIQGNYTDSNRSASRITGFTEEELLKKNIVDLIPEYVRPEAELHFKRVVNEGFATGEFPFLRKNGETGYWSIDAIKLTSDTFLGFVVDITEKKIAENALIESRAKLDAALDSMTDAVFISDLNGFFVDFNSSFATFHKFSSKSDCLRSLSDYPDIIQVCYEDGTETPLDLWAVPRALKGESVQNAVYLLKRKDSGESWFGSYSFSPIRDSNGEIVGSVTVARDITENIRSQEILIEKSRQIEAQYEEYLQLNEVLRQTNLELSLSKEKAEESDRLKTAFLQNMSHEIRTPLNGIIGFSNILREEDLSKEEIHQFTGVIQQSGQRLIDIVNNVLEISKIETGQVQIHEEQFSINSMFDDLYSFFVPLTKSKNLEFNCFKEKSDPQYRIITDRSKLFQILSNLINNAIKFTHSGSVTFGYKISAENIIYFVKDTGIGIENELQGRIFDRFVQGDMSITKNYEGAGLGLSICKGLAELLGGNINLESVAYAGTTFTVTLPLQEVKNTDTLLNAQIGTSILTEKLKILIAEDDLTSFMYLERLLQGNNINIFYAENGEDAVKLVEENSDFSIVLMDIKMPVMDGIIATSQIKKIRPELPVIAQTAYAFQEEKQRILDAGCDDYISKPVGKEILFEMITKYTKIFL